MGWVRFGWRRLKRIRPAIRAQRCLAGQLSSAGISVCRSDRCSRTHVLLHCPVVLVGCASGFERRAVSLHRRVVPEVA